MFGSFRCVRVAAILCLLVGPEAAWARTVGEQWGQVDAPAPGAAQSIGSPAAGCISGAVALPLSGDGYQVLRPARNRFWGHPRTVEFLKDLGRQSATVGLGPILIGDMSQPRGGPMAFGHGSHQTGLDVDIWFRLPGHRLNSGELANPQPVSMVRGTQVDMRNWGAKQLKLLELAAKSPQVDRIFVNAPIKIAACQSVRGDRSWLSKLRPWWGHDEHFHVRLTCTAGDPGCIPQAPVPDGDGCGAEVESWGAKSTLLPTSSKDKPNTRSPILPQACGAVLKQGDIRDAAAR